MITPAYCRTMSAYNATMNRRFYAAAATLTDEARRLDRGAFFGSVHATLSHLLWADTGWMARLAGWNPPGVPLADSPRYVAAFDDLRARRADADARIADWAAELDPARLSGDLTYVSAAAGREFTRPVALLVTHLFNHQTHHRGQVHAMLTAAGATTGATDLPFVL